MLELGYLLSGLSLAEFSLPSVSYLLRRIQLILLKAS